MPLKSKIKSLLNQISFKDKSNQSDDIFLNKLF